MKIEEYEPANIPKNSVNENILSEPVPKKYIATTTSRVEITVPSDLLIVCHRLSSNIFLYVSLPQFTCVSCVMKFSLILSKIMIVSLIL